jgi:hypothetical protein
MVKAERPGMADALVVPGGCDPQFMHPRGRHATLSGTPDVTLSEGFYGCLRPNLFSYQRLGCDPLAFGRPAYAARRLRILSIRAE